jgi:hypothetical protein
VLLTDLINCVSRLWNPPVTNQKTERPILTVPVHRQINNQQGEAPVALAKAAAQIAGSGLVWKWICTDGRPKLCSWDSSQRVFLGGELNDWIYFFGRNWRIRDTNNIEYLGPSPIVADRLIQAVLAHRETPIASFALQLQRKREAVK